jgi:hypothetical protein
VWRVDGHTVGIYYTPVYVGPPLAAVFAAILAAAHCAVTCAAPQCLINRFLLDVQTGLCLQYCCCCILTVGLALALELGFLGDKSYRRAVGIGAV